MSFVPNLPAPTLPVQAAVNSNVQTLQQLFDGIQDYAIFLLDCDGRVESWSAGAERIKGYSADEILGQHFSCFYTREDVANGKPERELEQAIRTGRVEDETWRVRKDGSRFIANVITTALRNDDGTLRGFAKITRDVTERKRAEEEVRKLNEELQWLVDGARDCAIVMLDSQGCVTGWNAGAERMKGYTAKEIVGANVSCFYLPEDIAAGKPQLELDRAALTGRIEDEGWRVRKDGSRFLANVIITALRDEIGGLRGFAKIIRDVTEKKQAEEGQRQLNLEQALRSQLEASNKELEAFTYSVSHDLRAPLRSVDSFSRIVLEDYGPTLGDEGNRLLGIVRSEAQRMGCLIDDLLRFSRIGRSEMVNAECDMAEIVGNTLASFDSKVMEGVTIELKMLPPAVGDLAMLRQVWFNLISNAVKFSSKTAGPTIEIGGTSSPDTITYYIKDNGAGFDPRFAKKLFGVFQRLHSEEEFEGTGVGLAIVQRTIQRHGGSVWAEGKVGEGATFHFTLPRQRESA
jgi:PAS domain S-box-containing protein